ncbi:MULTISPECIES: PucR family transcriptional regulator [unclassified Streptomyces]|uniref:PucR family transcriptional regulator n=1 Tax=unclassified Streptomyces TaxID=2593676 RepID=UPI0036E042F3
MNLADSRGADDSGTSLGRLATVLGVGVAWAGRSDTEFGDVLIAEPGDDLAEASGALVLAIGARGAAAVAFVTAAGRAGAAAVMVRIGGDGVPEPMREAAETARVALMGIPNGVRWDKAEAEARGVLERATAAPAPQQRGDLFSLAHTVATLTHGVVSIEDSAHRVMAYAGAGDEADELRRQSILGRNCPEPYLSLLRRWGVYRRVRAGEEVVEVEEQPGMGIRRRLVIGINAGPRPLGTIWVQEGHRPLAEHADQVMQGASRLAVSQLVDHYYQGDSATRLFSRAELSHGLLTGRFNSAALALHLGITPSAATTVVALDLRDRPERDTAWQDARRAEAAEIVSVHAASYRRNALVAEACGQIYTMLPEPAPAQGAGTASDDPSLVRWVTDLVATLRRHLKTPVQAAVAGTAQRLDDVPTVKRRGHHALEVMARTPELAVDTHGRLTASLMVRDLLELLERHDEVRHPALQALVDRDAEHGTEFARSLLLYLDAFGDVARVAKSLNVHPNTLRYRIRKAASLTGLDLDDPEHRLAAMLQLRLGEGAG